MLREQYERWQSDLEAQRRAEEERRAREAREAEERRLREAREAEERRLREAREADERAERARRDREAEEKRQVELRKFAEDRDRCRQFRIVAACDAALQSPHATYQDRADLNGWRNSGVKFADNLAACRKHEVAACDEALAFPAVPEQTRTILLRWRAEAPLHQRAFGYLRGAWGGSLSWFRERAAGVADLPTSTLVAGGLALGLALILAAVLAIGRRSPRSSEFDAPIAGWPRAEPTVAPGDGPPDPFAAEQPEPKSIEPGSTDMTTESLSLAERMTRTGMPRVIIRGASIHGTYATSRGIASFFGLIGWLLVGGGALAAFAGLSAGPFGLMIVAIGIGLAVAGLLQVAAGQMLRATVDSADYARQALLLQIAMAEGRSEIDLQRVGQ